MQQRSSRQSVAPQYQRVPLREQQVWRQLTEQECAAIINPNSISLYNDDDYCDGVTDLPNSSNNMKTYKKKSRQNSGKRVYAKKKFREHKTVPVYLMPGLAFISSSSGESGSLKEIYAFLGENFLGLDLNVAKWKNSIRNVLCKEEIMYMKDEGSGNYRFNDKRAFFLRLETFCRKNPDINKYGLINIATWPAIMNGTRGIPIVPVKKFKVKKIVSEQTQPPVQQMLLSPPMPWPGVVMVYDPQQGLYFPMVDQHPQQYASQENNAHSEMIVEGNFNGGPFTNQGGYSYTEDNRQIIEKVEYPLKEYRGRQEMVEEGNNERTYRDEEILFNEGDIQNNRMRNGQIVHYSDDSHFFQQIPQHNQNGQNNGFETFEYPEEEQFHYPHEEEKEANFLDATVPFIMNL